MIQQYNNLQGGTDYVKTKTPFGRMGGKSLLAKRIIEYFPDTEDYDIYVEPFVGAGNIFFRTVPEEGIKEVINDKDRRVYLVLKGLQEDSQKVNKEVKRGLVSKEYFEHIKGSKKPADIITVFKNSFLQQGNYHVPNELPRPIKTDYSEFFEDRLKGVTILNEDFSNIIKKYDSPRTLFYLDPPYESLTKKDYPDYCTPEDVYKSCKGIKGFFVLSYNDSSNIRSIFKEFKIIELKTLYNNTSNNQTKQELLILNYNPK
jgi:DNA adenine methylase